MRRDRLTPLECKALWLLAEHGAFHPPLSIQLDPDLRQAGERAIEKIWRQYRGIGERRWLWFWPFGRKAQTSANQEA
jgi:hypothetical protein